MAGSNIRAAAVQAQLNPEQKAKVDDLSKLLDTHRALLNLPSGQAQQKFQSLPADQQQGLTTMFADDGKTQKTGWLDTVKHYASPIGTAGKAALQGLVEVGDFMTRLYRTSAVARAQADTLPRGGFSGIKAAWDIANDKGELVLDPNRIEKAKEKYGADRISVAIKADQGMPLDEIQATGTPEEQRIAAEAAQNQDNLFQDAIDAVKAAKYSPGRQVANTILPESLEGSGFLYKGVSGTVDTAYRLFADPTLLLGKAKKAYDVANYAMFKIAGNAKNVDKVFTNPRVVNFFDTYGAQLDELGKARKAKDIIKAEEASTMLRRIAPEFGPSAVDEFIKAGVKNAETAKNYLANHADVKAIIAGQPARVTPLIPRLDLSRQIRINALTAGDKILNIDKVGQKLVSALYGTAPAYDDINAGLVSGSDRAAILEGRVGKLKGPTGVVRFSTNQIQGRLDRFAAKFTTIPYFPNGFFDVASPNASDQIYRISRLTNSRYHSKIIAEAFAAGTEGQKKQIFKGLWNTVAEIRGVPKSQAGMTYMDEFAGRGLEKKYAADIVVDGVNKGNPANFNGQQVALFPYQLSSGIAVPSIVDLDRLSARAGLIGRIMGLSHQKWVEKMTSLWTIGTLAGPRFALRNATEDLMVHLAIGDSPWGIVRGRLLSSRLRLARGGTGGESIGKVLKNQATLNMQANELGVIQKLVRRKELAAYKAKLDAATSADEVRSIMAEAVMHNSLGYKVDPEGARYIAEFAKYGNLDNLLADISEGGKNAYSGGDQYLSAANDVAKYGKMEPIEINGAKYVQATGEKAFTNFNPVASEQSRMSWLIQLGITSNDALAKIALKNLNNEEVALREMASYLSKLPDAELKRFELYSEGLGGNINVHAKKAFDAVKNLYSKRNGDINENLLAKVRKVDKDGNIVVSTKELSIEDLPTAKDTALTPEFISGPTLVPVAESGNFAASLTDRAWDAMGEANARFSREPIVLNELIRYRKEMADSGYEKHVMDFYTKGLEGEKLIKAQEYARKQILATAEDLAKNRVLSYVDNPAVRSQLAMSARNFARFYRATEDFYRRVYRTVRYNPESIRRATLTYEGITHSGFVQQDDNGDSYFFYPGLTPVYQTMSGIASAFGAPEAFKTPMPVEFGGKLNMITPSMNPDSLFPTFAGPVAALPLKFVFNLVPQFDGLEKALLGKYSEDQPMINAIFPAHLTRFLSTMDRNERNSQYASAMRKAATYLEATGHGVKPTWNEATQQWIAPTPAELEEYKSKLQASSASILAVRFITGFFAPASPQTTLKSEMAQWARDNERVNFKQVYNNLVNRYNGNVDRAMQEWIALYPDQMPYTVGESETDTVTSARAIDGSIEWLKNNNDVVDKYREGSMFLMPRVGEFNFDAYKLLISQGLTRSKRVETFLQDVSTARDVQFYYQQKDNFDAQLAQTYSDPAKKALKDQWDQWSKQFKGARPLLQSELGQGSERAIKRQIAYKDLQNMLLDPSVRKANPQAFDVISQMSKIYDDYVYNKDLTVGSGAASNAYKDILQQNVKAQLQKLAESNPNALNVYNVIFSRLVGD